MKLILTLLFCITLSLTATAAITERGEGMIFGKDHAFAFTATDDWVLDNESAASQGLHMVFYPKQHSWQNSPVIAYGRSIGARHGESIKSQVQYTIDDFRRNGSPNFKGEYKQDINLDNGKLASVYFYSGDKWGNYEAVAYIQEKNTINFLVFNARTKQSFTANLDAFYQMVNSYENRYVDGALTEEEAEALTKKSDSHTATPGGKEYENAATKHTAELMRYALSQCTSYFPDMPDINFSYFVLIKPNGSIASSDITPSNSLTTCFRGLMSQARYPTHSFEEFLLKFSVTIEG